MAGDIIRIEGVSKHFGDVVAVDDVSLEILDVIRKDMVEPARALTARGLLFFTGLVLVTTILIGFAG